MRFVNYLCAHLLCQNLGQEAYDDFSYKHTKTNMTMMLEQLRRKHFATSYRALYVVTDTALACNISLSPRRVKRLCVCIISTFLLQIHRHTDIMVQWFVWNFLNPRNQRVPSACILIETHREPGSGDKCQEVPAVINWVNFAEGVWIRKLACQQERLQSTVAYHR